MCSGTRRVLFPMSMAVIFSAFLLAAPGVGDRQEGPVAVVTSSVQPPDASGAPPFSDEAAMVLAGTVLIGAAAAVRRAA